MAAAAATGPSSVTRFKRHVDALAGMYYRLDTGRSGGRNSNATEQGMDAHMRAARAVLAAAVADEADPLPEWLDAHPRYAAKWNALERRYVGCRA